MSYPTRRAAPSGPTVSGAYRVTRVMFAGDGGFRILRAQPVNGGEEVALKGTLHDAVRGSILEVEGRWVTHPKFGAQVEVRTCVTLPPEDRDGAAVYLAGCPGLTEAAARRIIEALGSGPELWREVESAGERLQGVRGIGVKLAESIREWYAKSREERETVTALASWGLTRRQINAALPALRPRAQARGCRIEELVRANPWLLAEEVDGVGLQTADEIASRLRLNPNCVERARAGVLVETLRADERDGHCWTDRTDLVARTARTLPIERQLVVAAVEQLIAEGGVVAEGERIYRAPVLAAERRVTDGILARFALAAADAEGEPAEV